MSKRTALPQKQYPKAVPAGGLPEIQPFALVIRCKEDNFIFSHQVLSSSVFLAIQMTEPFEGCCQVFFGRRPTNYNGKLRGVTHAD